MATRRTPGGSSPQRGGTPKPRVRPAPPQGAGPNPGDACGVENAPQRGATRPTWPHSNASPHARPPFQPWALECHHVVVKTRTRPVFDSRNVVAKTFDAGAVIRRSQKRVSRRRGAQPDEVYPNTALIRGGFHHDTVRTRRDFTTTWWHNKAQGSGPRRKAWGPNPGDACGAEMHPEGVRQDRRGPIRPRHHTHVPRFNPRTNRAALHGETAFCSTPLGFRSPNRRRPRVRLPGPRGRGAGPWALECHHVVVKTRIRCVLDGVSVAAGSW